MKSQKIPGVYAVISYDVNLFPLIYIPTAYCQPLTLMKGFVLKSETHVFNCFYGKSHFYYV